MFSITILPASGKEIDYSVHIKLSLYNVQSTLIQDKTNCLYNVPILRSLKRFPLSAAVFYLRSDNKIHVLQSIFTKTLEIFSFKYSGNVMVNMINSQLGHSLD